MTQSIVKPITTKEEQFLILQTSTRCTQAVLRSFGIDSWPETGSGVLGYLFAHGYKVTAVTSYPKQFGVLQQALAPELIFDAIRGVKNYLIFTPGHVISFVNGMLVDTAGYGITSRVRIEQMWEVTRA